MKFKRLLMILFFMISACSSLWALPVVFKEPIVTADSFKITGYTYDTVEIIYKLRIENPNSVPVTMEVSDWVLTADKIRAASGSFEKTKIAGDSIKYIELPVVISFPELYEQESAFLQKEQCISTMRAALEFKLPIFGKKNYEISFVTPVDLLKKPSFDLNSIELVSMDPEEICFTLNIDFQNMNDFGIDILNFKYSLDINGTNWTRGLTSRKLHLEPGQKQNVPLSISIRTGSMVSDIYNVIISSDDISYECAGTFVAESSYPDLESAEIPFSIAGNTKIRL